MLQNNIIFLKSKVERDVRNGLILASQKRLVEGFALPLSFCRAVGLGHRDGKASKHFDHLSTDSSPQNDLLSPLFVLVHCSPNQ